MRITVQGVDVPVPSFVPMSLGLAPMTLEVSRLSSSFGDVLIVGAEGCGDIKMIPLKDLGLQLIPRVRNAQLEEEINKLKQKLKDSHLHKNGDREAF
tara:strand:+ start:6286 stop:6576 length:291 start_codon:yes stop_codon:yes gene_type:complete